MGRGCLSSLPSARSHPARAGEKGHSATEQGLQTLPVKRRWCASHGRMAGQTDQNPDETQGIKLQKSKTRQGPVRRRGDREAYSDRSMRR